MKTAKNLSTGAVDSTVVKNAIRKSFNINAIPRLIADWNLNRYVIPKTDNVVKEDDEDTVFASTTNLPDRNVFPVSSIIEPNRPTKGAPKAIIGQAVVSGKYSSATESHFYIGSDEDHYKYWISPLPTNASGVFPNHTDGQTTCRPYVLYPKVLKSNKIVIKLEDTWARPNSFSVRTRASVLAEGGDINTGWTTAATGPTIRNDGTIVLYFNGTSWVSTKPANPVITNVAGIQLVVNSMKGGVDKDGTTTTYKKRNSSGTLTQYNTDGKNSYCSVISMEAHLEADLTSRLEGVSDTFDMGEVSQLYPIGTITSNVSELTLANDDGLFNNENTDSIYADFLHPNVEFNMEYIYDVAGVKYSVQQFHMYCGLWDGQYSETISLGLEDSSKFLKEIKPRPCMYENKPVTEIIWRILDSVGFTNYDIDESDLTTSFTIPVFWINGEETVWEILDQIANSTQTAIYFDANDRLQVKTRDAAFNDAATPAWTLRGVSSGDELSDIEEMNGSDEFEANNIDVKYKATKWRVGTTGKPAMAKVWEPDTETLVTRATPLYTGMTKGATKMYFKVQDVPMWPYASKVQVDGEILSYEGKEFVYYTYTENTSGPTVTYTNPVKHVVVVKSEDEKNQYNNKTPLDYRSRNYLTGAVIIKERGLMGTVVADHPVNANGWATQAEYVRGTANARKSPAPTFTHSKHLSLVTLTSPNYLRDAADTYWVYRGGSNDTPFRMYGTRLRFRTNSSYPTQRAGIAIAMNSTRNNGYYIEVRPTLTIGTAEAQTVAEVMIYSKKNGKYAIVSNGARVAVVRNRFYDLDVQFTPGSTDRIDVWLNGQRVALGYSNAQTKQPSSGKFAMYVRGRTVADYEYFYGATRSYHDYPDNFGYHDLIYGGMRSGFFIREILYELKQRYVKRGKKKIRITYRLNNFFFDEFGPWVHELREFDVKFDPNPVQYSTVFNTNTWHSAVIDYRSTPFGAKFTVANVARHNAVLHGEDSKVFNSAENTINQVCVVLGRDLEISDEEVVNAKNEQSIRARGKVDTELVSDWLQTKEMAEAVATWIAKHWSSGLDSLSVQIFGNPLIEIGDVVAIDYPEKDMSPTTHKYFVTGVSSDFDFGISTTLTLRRVRTTDPANITVTP